MAATSFYKMNLLFAVATFYLVASITNASPLYVPPKIHAVKSWSDDPLQADAGDEQHYKPHLLKDDHKYLVPFGANSLSQHENADVLKTLMEQRSQRRPKNRRLSPYTEILIDEISQISTKNYKTDWLDQII